jgi:hypothetical protein
MMEACRVEVDPFADGGEFYNTKVVTARKIHVCDECDGKIQPGQKYEQASGVYEGIWWHSKTCTPCLGVRRDFFVSWLHGGMREMFHDQCGFDYCSVPWSDGEEEVVFPE